MTDRPSRPAQPGDNDAAILAACALYSSQVNEIGLQYAAAVAEAKVISATAGAIDRGPGSLRQGLRNALHQRSQQMESRASARRERQLKAAAERLTEDLAGEGMVEL